MSRVSIALVAPYLSPGSIGPRAARSRRLAEGFRSVGHEVGAVVVDDGLREDDVAGAQILARAPGPLVGEMGDPGMNTRRRFRAALAERARRYAPLPDAHIRWAFALARDPALRQPPPGVEVVYAVAAPFSSLVLGAVLGRRWGVPVIGDLGDPWPTRGSAEARLAAWTLRRLAALVVTNDRTADAYREQLDPAAPLVVAPNGADELHRTAGEPGEPPLFLQLGTLSNLRVDPGPAFEALARLDREGALRFRSHGEAWVRLSPQAARHHLGVIPEDEARTLMRAATALLVVGNRNAIQIPSKVYEIARSDIWALCVSELDAEPGAELLRLSGHGVVSANDEEEIRAAALGILEREGEDERPVPVADHSWEVMVGRVVELLPRVSSAPSTAAPATASPPVRTLRRGLRRARVRAIAARITSDGASRRRLVEMLEQERYDPPDAPEPVALRALGGAPVWLRPGSADSDVAVGAFHGFYHLPSADLESPRLIWDLGCNIGLTMRQMAADFPAARIVGVDLDAENLRLAERNIESVADRCELIEGAIWTSPGTMSYSTPNGEDAYRVTGSGDRTAPAILLDDLRERFGAPDYVKMDIEGAENRVLEERTGWASSVKRIGVEYHAPYDLAECERDLRKLGFDGFEVHRRGLLRRGSDSVYAYRR